MTMVQVAWATLGILTATIVAMFVYFGGKFDAVNARIDGLANSLNGRVDGLTAQMKARFDALSARIDSHLEEHHRTG